MPVTVKMRLGWDEATLNAPVLARRAEQSGVRMITVHGRTRCQFYQGSADWRAIARVKQAVSIPVAANGDVATPADAAAVLSQSGADAVMIGRAHYGAPWIAGSIAEQAAGRTDERLPRDASEVADYVVQHYHDMLSLYGIESGLRQARKHLGWYLDRHAEQAPAELRRTVLTATEPHIVIAALRSAFIEGARFRELREVA